jgi:hypothetical protein
VREIDDLKQFKTVIPFGPCYISDVAGKRPPRDDEAVEQQHLLPRDDVAVEQPINGSEPTQNDRRTFSVINF